MQFFETLNEFALGVFQYCILLLLPTIAAAKDYGFVAGADPTDEYGLFIVRIAPAFDALKRIEFEEVIEERGTGLALPIYDIIVPLFPQCIEVVLTRHAPVDNDHRLASIYSCPFKIGDRIKQCPTVADIPRKDLVPDNEPFGIEYDPHRDQWAVRTLFFGCHAAAGEIVAVCRSFEIAVGQVVEKDCLVKVEKVALLVSQVGLKFRNNRKQLVADSIEAVLGPAFGTQTEQVGKRSDFLSSWAVRFRWQAQSDD